MKIQLLNDRFTFKEVKNEEKIYVDVFVSLLLHITEGTYYRQFVKFAQLLMFLSWAKI